MQEEVETTLKAAGQLHPLALLYETKGILPLALQVWKTLALDNGVGDSQMVSAREAARLLESSSDSVLVLQHVEWVRFWIKHHNLVQHRGSEVITSTCNVYFF